MNLLGKLLIPFLLSIPATIFAGALEDGEPTLENVDLVPRVAKLLKTFPDRQLRPHVSAQDGKTYAYYLNQIGLIGRCNTFAGPRNVMFCGFTRSAAYSDKRTAPARGHRFILFFNDKLELDFFTRTDAWLQEVSLEGAILKVDGAEFDLRTESGLRYCRDSAL